MDSRLFSNTYDGQRFDNPLAIFQIRQRIATLPTSNDRILAIKELGVEAQNFVCNLIINDLLADRSVLANYALYRTLNSISLALHKESYAHLDLKRGWSYMLGHKTLYHEATALNDPGALSQLNSITLTEANQTLWRELSDWFAGKYYQFAFKDGRLKEFKKGILGNYPLLDFNDRLLWLFTGVRQLDLSTPYYMMSQTINSRMPANTASK